MEEKIFCCYCGKLIGLPLRLTTEHLVPLSRGGNGSYYNKRPCCHRCNHWRGNKPLWLWKAEIEAGIEDNAHWVRFRKKENLEIIIANIEYLEHYIETAGIKLYDRRKICAQKRLKLSPEEELNLIKQFQYVKKAAI